MLRMTTALVALGIAGGMGSQAGAEEFRVNDDITITTNVTLSAGISFRTEDRSGEAILPGNGARIGAVGTAATATQDDGNLNFDRGDVVTAPITVVADAEFNYRDDIGFFIRGKGVYDAALDNRRAEHGHAPNGYALNEPLNDENFNTLAQFATATILDAFLFGEVDAGPVPIELRAGRQVISWGESVFIQNGINSINPIDVTAFRRPGVQLKEGLLPLGMIYANAGVTDNLSIEGFWNFEWQQTQPDGCGTFFSTADVVAQGCNELSLASVSSAAVAEPIATLNAAIGVVQAGIAAAQAAGDAATEAALSAQLGVLNAQLDPLVPLTNDQGAQAAGFFVRRGGDRGPDDFDGDNFGIAARYYVDSIDTELGLFFHRLDSRLPFVGFTSGAIPIGAGFGFNPLAAEYNVEYPEDIHTVGASFATNLFGLAVAGEMSYRPDHPVQINTNDLTAAAIFLGNTPATVTATNPADALFNGVAPGSAVEGFITTDQIRGQASAVAFFDRALGSDRVTAVGELGFEWLPSLNSDNPLNLNFGRASVFGNPGTAGNNAEGLITQFSAGFQGRVSAAYSNVFAGVNMTPSLSWKQDLVGQSSDGQFLEGRTALGFGLAFDYLNRYTLALNYTTSFGGTFNAFDDRDFASAVVSMQF